MILTIYFLNGNTVNISRTSWIHSLLQMNSKMPLKSIDQNPTNGPENSLKISHSLWRMCTPHLIHQCLGQPHSPPQVTARSLHAPLHNYATKSPMVTMGHPTITPKVTLPVGWFSPSSICLILGPSQPTIPNGIQNQSAIFHNSPDRPTDG